ncbi:Uncharacterized protein ALO43_00809 [Pseudomonas tremae]|uniref:Uncharacterized protein n=2 Tax=Pseudomonas syringae group TaxID=136849 RepID=A0AB37QIZ3_9PSED|nr:hypothetical protein OA77_02480 [Pseudomonas coronafaciens]KPZ02462.1 Uncharacterized protein ALO43_00809 [Pseudomonas tremae]RMM35768.1 hypothetical protein ALQ80_00279 [Pseudomonas coronafaciens pv. oryzae]RMN91514.1 hypothetical protein ALQ50_00422 [Pseudomonas coronafaciens pv. coronafaciens]RMO11296.1 hypothetical protein ALQ48_04889 [Pseudomonas coronafaciens pv. zizaniae]RMR95703.1 hypothetical protein ALP74_01423 [Pseudomonas coronafaciens pv. garcae]
MDFTRLQCEHLPKRAGMTLTAAIELLNTLPGNAYQIAVMPVGIVSMALKVRVQGLDACIKVASEVYPVCGRQKTPESMKAIGYR